MDAPLTVNQLRFTYLGSIPSGPIVRTSLTREYGHSSDTDEEFIVLR